MLPREESKCHNLQGNVHSVQRPFCPADKEEEDVITVLPAGNHLGGTILTSLEQFIWHGDSATSQSLRHLGEASATGLYHFAVKNLGVSCHILQEFVASCVEVLLLLEAPPFWRLHLQNLRVNQAATQPPQQTSWLLQTPGPITSLSDLP